MSVATLPCSARATHSINLRFYSSASLETVFLFTSLICDIWSSGWIAVMLTSTFFSTCHLSSTSWVSFTELSSGCGDKAYYHSFDSSLFIMPCDSWKMREDSARQDFKIIVTTPYCFWIVQKFLEMQCVEHWWGKSWHWREGSLEQTLGSCLGKAFSQLRVAYPLGTRLWPDLFVPAATISSVTPSKVQSGFRVLWLYVYICHGDQSLISSLYLSD